MRTTMPNDRYNRLPRTVRKGLATFARKLASVRRALFASDPIYRKRAGQFLAALFSPKPRRRGRPRNSSVTRLIAEFRRQYPGEREEERGLDFTLSSEKPELNRRVSLGE